MQLFASLGTQWRVGMAGPTGLDYAAVWAVLHATGKSPSRQRLLFEGIQIMEREALKVMAASRK